MKLEGKNLTFSYDKQGQAVFRQVNLCLDNTEKAALMGPSGFGKTTLCKVLAGYVKPQEGEVLLDGKPLPEKGYCPVQMVWQHPERAVNPRLKLGDTLADGRNVPDRIIRALGIEEDWKTRYPQELSGGELQRFCIARALGEGTRFLIADEISTMLDPITQSQIWTFLLEEVKRRQIGLLVVSHSEPLLEQIGARRIYFGGESKPGRKKQLTFLQSWIYYGGSKAVCEN